MFTLFFLLLNLVTITSHLTDIYLHCPDVTLRCIKSHLYHFVSLSTLIFYVHFYHCTACTVDFHCLHVGIRLLRVTLNSNQPINQPTSESPRFSFGGATGVSTELYLHINAQLPVYDTAGNFKRNNTTSQQLGHLKKEELSSCLHGRPFLARIDKSRKVGELLCPFPWGSWVPI